jgi:hypothetical protein
MPYPNHVVMALAWLIYKYLKAAQAHVQWNFKVFTFLRHHSSRFPSPSSALQKHMVASRETGIIRAQSGGSAQLTCTSATAASECVLARAP